MVLYHMTDLQINHSTVITLYNHTCSISHRKCGSYGCEVHNVQNFKNNTPSSVRKEVVLRTCRGRDERKRRGREEGRRGNKRGEEGKGSRRRQRVEEKKRRDGLTSSADEFRELFCQIIISKQEPDVDR